jgi:hypothetical protein
MVLVLVLLVTEGRASGINSAGLTTESRAPIFMVLINTALRRIGRGITSSIFEFCFVVYLSFWDISLTLINALTFNRKVGRVTPKGHPGEGGIWPEYIPPKPGDSRCSCPALNAMANHGSSPLAQAKLSSHVHVLRYPPTRRTQHYLPRAVWKGPRNLQLCSFVLPLRAARHRARLEPLLQHWALRPLRHRRTQRH